jgi:hypothetical protein
MVGHNNDATERILIAGKAHFDRCDNKVKSARYTLLTFFPKVRAICCGGIAAITSYIS